MSYRWQDGSTAPTYLAFGPGTYKVEVPSRCGQVSRTFRVEPISPSNVFTPNPFQGVEPRVDPDRFLGRACSPQVPPEQFRCNAWFVRGVRVGQFRQVRARVPVYREQSAQETVSPSRGGKNFGGLG